jgi:O-6-methylguanine DNA methyltransferase
MGVRNAMSASPRTRVHWVEAASVNTDNITVTITDTVYGQLVTADVDDILLEAAFLPDATQVARFETALSQRFSPKTLTRHTGTVWHDRLFDRNGALTVITPDTAFRHSVHDALTTIAYGATVSYSALAALIGRPTATRAVAAAVAANRVAVAIPCHRVWRSDDTPGGFRWGTDVKRQLCRQERDQI